MESKENLKILAAAATDFVNRIDHETQYLFTPRYTDFKEGRREQTNPYANLTEAEQTEAILDGLTMVLGQIAASAFVASPKVDQTEVYNHIFRRVRMHAEAYHQQFLHMREKAKDDTQAG